MSRDIGYALMVLKLQIALEHMKTWAPNLARAMQQREQTDFLLRR